MGDRAEVRRLDRAEGLPGKTTARLLGTSRNIVGAKIAGDVPPKYERQTAEPAVDAAGPRMRQLPRALVPYFHGPVHARDHADSSPPAADRSGSPSLDNRSRYRRGLQGSLAAVFFAGSGLLGLITLLLPVPESEPNVITAATLSTVSLVLGAASWRAPWARWPRQASLGLLPPAFALIALANTLAGGNPYTYTYGVFFVVAFVWIGIAHPRLTSVAMAPLATAAYVVPLFFVPGDTEAGLSTAVITIPVCVLVGEAIAWGVARIEQIELALQRERSRAEHLRELDDMKDAFLSAVSHELRTPITICRGHLDVMSDKADEQEVRAVKKMLVDELDLMSRLVEDLTTLARGNDPSLLRIESLPLSNFVSSITVKAEPILGNRLRVEFDMNSATLRADPQRVTQALLNLLRNAAEHAHGDRPVRLRVRPEPTAWRFEVADEGGGLPPGDEQLVFEPFSTGSSSTGGAGLGLSIVRGIARAHGGESGVVNQPGRGATFWMRIPQ